MLIEEQVKHWQISSRRAPPPSPAPHGEEAGTIRICRRKGHFFFSFPKNSQMKQFVRCSVLLPWHRLQRASRASRAEERRGGWRVGSAWRGTRGTAVPVANYRPKRTLIVTIWRGTRPRRKFHHHATSHTGDHAAGVPPTPSSSPLPASRRTLHSNGSLAKTNLSPTFKG